MCSSSSCSRNEWKYALCAILDARIDPDVVTVTYIKEKSLVDTLNRTIGGESWASIQSVYEYKLINKQPSFTGHVYLVFQTSNFWWSLEKDSKGITLQRSTNQECVRDNCKNAPRSGKILQTKKDMGRITVGELISWLYNRGELTKGYHWWKSNCKKFARDAFDKMLGTDGQDKFTPV